MLLAVDLGNTSFKAGLFSKEGRLLWNKRLPQTGDNSFLALLEKTDWPRNVEEVRLASVVPELTKDIKAVFKKILKAPVTVLRRADLPIKANVREPGKVGIDRLLNGLAVRQLHGCPAVVIDCGTALTFDLIDGFGEYAGGIIAPSPELARDALFEKTALLPKIRLMSPASVVGKSTTEGMRSGLVLGFAEMTNGLLKRLKREWTPKFKVVGTGGGIKLILPYLSSRVIFDPDLTLKGIYLSI